MPALRSPIVRIAALLSLVAGTACGDSPAGLGAAQNSDTAMLAEILDKLESIEDRLDSLDATVGGLSGGGLVLTGLPAAQLDSVLALTSFLAVDVTSGSWEACGAAELAGEFGVEWKGGAEGEGAGHLGAWAGTGAYAGGKAKASGEFGGGFKIEGTGGVEFCYPLGGDAPPVRPAPAGPMRSPELNQLRTTLEGLTNQFNLTPASLNQSINGVGTAIASPGSLSLSNLGGHLPLPPALSAIAANPMGTVSGKLQGVMSTAESALCSSSSWGTNVASIIAEACDVIDAGGLANITAFADMASTYPVVQTAVTNVCTRVNSIGLQRLIIPSWDVTFPAGIGTVTVFPGYNQRLFGSYTSLACP